MKHTFRISVLAALAFFVVLGGSAMAASPQTIYKDAQDGSIDGNYSLADLRNADAQISADTREYILWDEVYAIAIARASSKNAPKPRIVKPTDSNGNGTIDADERAKAAQETRELNKTIIKKYKKKPTKIAQTASTTSTTDTDDSSAAASSSNDDDGGDTNWPLILLVAAIIVVALVGVWRVIVTRKKPEDDGMGSGRN